MMPTPARNAAASHMSAWPDSVVPDPSRLTNRLRALLAVVLVADVLDLMDSTITNIAAPTIVRDLGGGESLIKWLGASYALSMGVLLVVGGRLGDRYGARRVFLIGIAGFISASLLAGLSVNPAMLIGARLLQGGFGAMLIPQGIGLLTQAFSREQLPRAFVAFGPVMGLSAILGPIVAGFLIKADLFGLTWRPMFLLNIVVGGIGLIAAVQVLPPDGPTTDVRIDGLGAGLLGASTLGLMFGLIQGSTDGWTSVPDLSMALGAVALLGFAMRQRLASNPLILPSLLSNRGFTSGMLLGLAYFAAVNGFAYVVSLFFQTTMGLSASRAAVGLTPLMAGIIVASFVGRPLISRLGRLLVLIGLVITLAGIVGLWATIRAHGTTVGLWALAPSLVVFGLGMGFCFSSIYDVAIGDIAADEAGSASGTLSAVQQFAAAIGAAVVTTIYFTFQTASDGTHAMTASLAVVGAISAACLGLVWLLPRRAPDEQEI